MRGSLRRFVVTLNGRRIIVHDIARLRRTSRRLRLFTRDRRTLIAVGANDAAHGEEEDRERADRGQHAHEEGRDAHQSSVGLTRGNRMVSRMPRPVSAMSRRSMPMPMPPVGGSAYSMAA